MAFIGVFEAMKMLSSHRALCCDRHQFCAKMTVSTYIVFKLLSLNIVVIMKNNIEWLLLPHAFAFCCLLWRLLGNYCRSGNFYCKNIFMVCTSHENKKTRNIILFYNG